MKSFVEDALFLLNVVGVNPYKKNKIKNVIAIIIFVLIQIQLIFNILLRWKGQDSFEAVADYFAVSQVHWKYLYVMIKSKQFVKIINNLSKFWPIENFGKTIKDNIETSNRKIERFIRIMKISYCFLIFSYIGKPILTGTKTLLVPTHIPYVDVFATPIFHIIYVEQTLSAVIAITGMMGVDILFIAFIFHAVWELRLIKHAFLDIPMDECSESICYRKLGVVVEHHGVILGFIKDVSDCYSVLVLSLFFSNTLCMCGGLLIMSVDGIFTNLGETIKSVIYLISLIGHVLFYSFAGSQVIEESESVADAVYETKWWNRTQAQLRNGFTFAILRSQRGAALTGGKMFILDLRCFTNILRTGFSFFTLIRTVYSQT